MKSNHILDSFAIIYSVLLFRLDAIEFMKKSRANSRILLSKWSLLLSQGNLTSFNSLLLFFYFLSSLLKANLIKIQEYDSFIESIHYYIARSSDLKANWLHAQLAEMLVYVSSTELIKFVQKFYDPNYEALPINVENELRFTLNSGLVDRHFCNFVIFYTMLVEKRPFIVLRTTFSHYPDQSTFSTLQEYTLFNACRVYFDLIENGESMLLLNKIISDIEDRNIAERFYYLLLAFTPGLDNNDLQSINEAIQTLFEF